MSIPSAAAASRARPAAAPAAGPPNPPPPGSGAPPPPLYADRVKVYPKAVQGRWRQVKWALLTVCLAIYYVVPWLRWDRGPLAPDQAVLIDLDAGRAYFLWIEIWPEEVYYVTGLLILAALALFLATSLLGRVWCGYACPQTVWTDLFMLVERLIEGDRNARMRRDKQPWSADKVARKLAKHAVWLLIAAVTGGAWILYFVDAPSSFGPILHGEGSVATYSFIALFTTTTYLLAGWAREQVCTYMCPWPRIQGALLDENSIVVTYRNWRGEPRGKHKLGTEWDGRGDCVDCMQCVVVCPTGIDIRDGQQLECIGCGLCIDACNGVMAKVGRPPNLIGWDTLANQEARASGRKARYRLWRPRTVLYVILIAITAMVMVAALSSRASVELTVQRDRNPLFVTLADGSIRNGYTVKVSNKSWEPQTFRLSVDGLTGALLSLADAPDSLTDLSARPDAVATRRVFVTVPADSSVAESSSIVFRARRQAGGDSASHDSIFLAPRK
ncbi:cytochrome c oxidase accessory protein FixG [Stella humosa]|uniref:Cytochrome c oxidase accessory protein FixG n=1 Tax=Stella humosa TaxID=94 RepID=A0A3N1KTC0_9PROT|nr:cytochrome c oxidase accessory protein CcoG [Stella humosa]ROP81346.1 cytochrome c oxidase accessory protein FixG [Stella humosa]BBK32696.1 ferredoxin [Stella humosa]